MKENFQYCPSEALWKSMDEAEEVLDVVAVHVSSGQCSVLFASLKVCSFIMLIGGRNSHVITITWLCNLL